MKVEHDNISVFGKNNNQHNPYQPGESEQLDGSGLYCEHVIKSKTTLNIPNATADEVWNNNPDLKLNMVAYLGVPILATDGTPFGTLCILDTKTRHFSDLTVELLETIKQSFEIQIAQLHQQEITQQHLQQEQQAHLIRGICHQINTPLGVSITAASFMQSKIEEIRAQLATRQLGKHVITDGLSNIEQASDLLLRNLNVAAKRVATMKELLADNNYQNKQHSLYRLLKNTFEHYQPAFEAGQIQYEIEHNNQGDCVVFTTPELLQQVLDILCTNSIQHGFNDITNPKIHIKIIDYKQHVKLHFYDNGHGISKELYPHIFSPFYSKTSAADFSGIGLSIAKRIVTHQLLGDITLQQSDFGTHFTISLPKYNNDNV